VSNLQPLFVEPILEQTYLDPGYSGHASDVWLVKTATEEVVVRASRLDSDQGHGTMHEFWWGCNKLFGIDPRRVFDLEPLNTYLNKFSPIPAPRVLRKGQIDDRLCVVLEYMPGEVLRGFRDKPATMLEQFGAALAQLHSERFADCGNPVGSFRYPLAEFPARMVETMRQLADHQYRTDRRMRAQIESMTRAVRKLPPPDAAALVLVDIGADQFLSDGDRLTAVVDTEAYVVGPPELDLICLEYSLDRPSAVPFLAGYRSVLPLPDLSRVRLPYRYLYRLLGVKGQVDWEEWLGWPCVFDDRGGRPRGQE
jgi:fructosamine-3-kinase